MNILFSIDKNNCIHFNIISKYIYIHVYDNLIICEVENQNSGILFQIYAEFQSIYKSIVIIFLKSQLYQT